MSRGTRPARLDRQGADQRLLHRPQAAPHDHHPVGDQRPRRRPTRVAATHRQPAGQTPDATPARPASPPPRRCSAAGCPSRRRSSNSPPGPSCCTWAATPAKLTAAWLGIEADPHRWDHTSVLHDWLDHDGDPAALVLAVAGATHETYDSASSGLPHRGGHHTGSRLWLDVLARHAGYTPTSDDLDDTPVADHTDDGGNRTAATATERTTPTSSSRHRDRATGADAPVALPANEHTTGPEATEREDHRPSRPRRAEHPARQRCRERRCRRPGGVLHRRRPEQPWPPSDEATGRPSANASPAAPPARQTIRRRSPTALCAQRDRPRPSSITGGHSRIEPGHEASRTYRRGGRRLDRRSLRGTAIRPAGCAPSDDAVWPRRRRRCVRHHRLLSETSSPRRDPWRRSHVAQEADHLWSARYA